MDRPGLPASEKAAIALLPFWKGLNFEDAGAGAPPLDFLLSGDIGHDAPRAPGDLGDAIGSEMRDQGVQRGGIVGSAHRSSISASRAAIACLHSTGLRRRRSSVRRARRHRRHETRIWRMGKAFFK
jgi:hypothetical protein